MLVRWRTSLAWRGWTERKRLSRLLAALCLVLALGAVIWRAPWRPTYHVMPVGHDVLREGVGNRIVTWLHVASLEPMREVRLAWTGACLNKAITISGGDLGQNVTREIGSEPAGFRQLKDVGPPRCAGQEDLVITIRTRSGKVYVLHDSGIPAYMLPD
ncbi:MAG: hypothetical protein K6U89_05590 [Chloroflexi bacterium]|nr:hypothetical protein [Chloroflexota bacterium]